MTLNEIIRYIKDRTGESTPEKLIYELNLAVSELWEITDPPGSLQEVYVRAMQEFVISLPPYVYQVKGIRYAKGQPVTLYSPRQYFQESAGPQHFLEWREIGRSPLIRTLTGAGRLTAKLSKPNGSPFTVTIKGPDSAANATYNDIDFGATDTKVQGTKAFTAVTDIDKSAVTSSDVSIYDVNDTLVGIILADQDRADNIVVRMFDPAISNIQNIVGAYQILYKTRPPKFVDGQPHSVDDRVGRMLQNMVSADLLRKSKDQSDQGRARAYDQRATRIKDTLVKGENEGKMIPVDLMNNPFVHTYHGRL